MARAFWGRVSVAGAFAIVVSFVAATAGAEGFYPAGGMSTSRLSAATVGLPDGAVLVISDTSVEKYYPAGRAFGVVAWLPVNHGSGLTATVLADGRVLIVGGQAWETSVANAEIYDPSTNSVTPTGSLSVSRSFHTATLLADGRVLVAGGHQYNHWVSALATAEVYDPASGVFSAVGDMTTARQDATATRLSDGRVLVSGGYGTDQNAQASADLFDPATDSFAAAAPMSVGRANHTATALADGSVLITGGHTAAPGPSLATAEVYDPASSAFLPTGDLGSARGAHTATLLDDGRVLVAGGFTAFPYAPTLSSAEIWDPATGTFASLDHGMREARGRHVAAALPGGEVLVAGGLSQTGSPGWSAEVYSPTFVDSQPPVLYAPNDITQAAHPAYPTGDYVYFYPWATDNVDANPVVDCRPPSGTLFPVGTTLVTCTATDSWGNSASASFNVTILPPLAFTFTVDAFGAVDTTTGVATVSGTVTCSRPASATANGQVSQIVASRATLTASFYATGGCGPQPTPWSATLSAQNGRFLPGRADLLVSPSASDGYSYVWGDTVQKTIHLRAKK